MILRGYATLENVATSNPGVVVHNFHEPSTGSWQYIVADDSTKNAVIIDPVLDYDPATATITTKTADFLLAVVKDRGYNIQMLLETHAHADHITAANYMKVKLGQMQSMPPAVGIGKRIMGVQEYWARHFGVAEEEYQGVFDKLLEDDETFHIGSVKATAVHLPGHTPDHMGYLIGDNIFVGDSMFNADLGSARADFPGGDARTLFRSGRSLLNLPDDVKIWSGHDYPPEDKQERAPYMTVREQRETNKHLKMDIDEDQFVALRKKRDATLDEPRLLHQALQMNIRGGRLPLPSPAGVRMLQIPLKLDHCQW
ncbi:hypothetical protein LTR84_006849 [Exophiala bonariae]|uniref:Metallo-beta-lactamase domain-containing protein n=1 Tax=Exophiala bonariae TaxID=1690606 RepID=A0AAV9N289_9EURO|nr:hypothetical protein LTR84_006849 [Exophiala bonariae]